MTPATTSERNLLPGLLLIFAVLALGIIAAGIGYHRTTVAQLRTKVERELAAVAELKVGELVQWRAERLSDARFFQQDKTLAARVSECLAQPGDAARVAALQAWLAPIQASHGYGVLLFDAEGQLRLNGLTTPTPVAAAIQAGVATALTSGEVTFLDFYRDESSPEVFLALLVPVRDASGAGRPIAVLVLQIDPRRYLFGVLQRWPLVSETAESLLVRREGSEAVFLNPLRFRSGAALALRFPLSRTELPAVQAVLGRVGSVEGVDYRGHGVLAAMRTVPDSPWHLVAHMDTTEALAASGSRLREAVVIVVALLFSAAAGVGVLWSRQQSRQHREKFLATQALRGSEARYRAVVDSANDAIVTINTAGEVVGWSGAAEKIFHYAGNDILGRPLLDILPPAGHAHFRADLRRMQTGDAPLTLDRVVELAGQRRDGTVFPMEISVGDWNVSGERFFTATIRDISDRRRAEDTVRLQSAALTAAANAIVITSRDGVVVWANPAFTTLTGYTLEEAVGKNPRDLVKSGEQQRAVYDQLWDTILTGGVWRGELINRRKDGAHYPEELTITPVCDAAGEITHFIAIKQDLTERKRADESLRMSERKFQSVFEQAAVGVIIAAGADGRFVNVNRRFCEMVGYTPEELAQLTSHAITHPDDLAADADQLDQMSLGHIREFSREKRYRRKDGTYVWAKVFVAPLDPAESKPTLRIGVITDVTARRQAEAALRETETRYRRLFESAKDGILILDAETGMVVDVNPFLIEILGYSHEAFLGKEVWELGFFKDIVANRAAFVQLQQLGYIRFEDKPLETAAGRRIDVEFVSNVYLVNGQRVIQCNIRDITDRKAAERQLREQNEILSNSHEGVMIVNLANVVSLWNRGAEEIFGWTAAEALGRPPEQLIGMDDLGVVTTLRTAVERDGFWHGELRCRIRDGRNLTVDCRTTLVRDEAGRPRARLNFLTDITEKKLLEGKLLHAQRLESLGMLAAGIAHDLNNVLAPIVFAAPMLRESLSSERDVKILDTLERSAGRGSALVKQILGFAHSTTGEFRPTQVKHLARDIADLMEETFPKSIRLEQQIPSNLWLVRGDPTQIHQVLLNLCVNARDAMPSGGTLHLTASNRQLDGEQARALPGARPGPWVVLEVADTGTGIAPDVLARIWEPFFTTKAMGKGTGLGLSTVRGIVVSHHGFVTLDSHPGQGSTFRIFLPATVEPAEDAKTVTRFDAPTGDNELILVVDDDNSVRETLAAILSKQNYRVLSARDGVEAVSYFTLHATEIALVVTDIDMPYLSGAALIRILKQQRPDLRLLAISGLPRNAADGPEFESARKLADAFLLKPFSYEPLLKTVHGLLHPTPKP